MSRPSSRALAIFVRERFPPVIALPIAAILALAALPPSGPLGLARTVVASAALLLALRVADDLADLEVDRVRAPDRALSSGRIEPTALAGWIPILLLVAGAATGTWASVATLLAGVSLYAAYFRARDRVPEVLRPPVVSAVFLLVPLLVTLASEGDVLTAVRVGLFAWSGVVAHDYAHDADRFPRPRVAAFLAAIAYAACATQGAVLAVRSTPTAAILVALTVGLVPTTALLARLLGRPTARNARALRIPGFLPVILPLLVLAAHRASGGAS